MLYIFLGNIGEEECLGYQQWIELPEEESDVGSFGNEPSRSLSTRNFLVL
jgi:hypothetical protein